MRAGLLGAWLTLGLGAVAPAAQAGPADSPAVQSPAVAPAAQAAPADSPAVQNPAVAPAAETDPADGPADLQSPEQRDTRNSAYSLRRGMWAFDAGALGLGGGDALMKLGVAYGLGAGVELQLNLAHWGAGILNFAAVWQFVDTRYFHLAARAGIWYGNGDWVWILTEAGEELVADLDVLNVPLILASSMPVSKRLQFDFDVRYTYADIFGSVTANGTFFRDAPFGMRQLAVRPGVRIFLTDSTEVDLSTSLPIYSARSYARPDGDRTDESNEFTDVPFSKTWAAEFGLRSRLAKALFGSVRLHYSKIADGFYGSSFYPSFNLEFRL